MSGAQVVTEEDRAAAHSIALLYCQAQEVAEHASICTAIAQAIARTREAATESGSVLGADEISEWMQLAREIGFAAGRDEENKACEALVRERYITAEAALVARRRAGQPSDEVDNGLWWTRDEADLIALCIKARRGPG